MHVHPFFENQALRIGTAGKDGAAMNQNGVTGDGKIQSASGFGALVVWRIARKWLEYPFKFSLWNTVAVGTDADRKGRSSVHGHTNQHLGVVLRVMDRVVHDVFKSAVQKFTVHLGNDRPCAFIAAGYAARLTFKLAS